MVGLGGAWLAATLTEIKRSSGAREMRDRRPAAAREDERFDEEMLQTDTEKNLYAESTR